MSEQTDKLLSLLYPFGFSGDEARIYLVLLEIGTASALTVSRKVRMGRTKVYRILDKLIAKGMVTYQADEQGFKFVAHSPAKLDLSLAQREAEVSSLRQKLPVVVEALERVSSTGMPGSKVLFYRGKKGIEQVNFNTLRAHGELLSFEIGTANDLMSRKDAERLRRELVANKIATRTITNAKRLEPFTEVVELVQRWWEIRYVDPALFTIRAEVFIYNDVYLLYRYTDEDVFAVEIYNQDLADMQRELFEFLWHGAKRFSVLSDRGEAEVT